MTERETQLLKWVIDAQEGIYKAIETGKVEPLPNALRKLASVAASLTAQPGMTLGKVLGEYETPEQPKLDKVALDIIKEPIAEEVPMETPKEEPVEEEKPKRTKRVRLNDFDTPLAEKDEAMDRDQKILYYRAQGKTLAWIGEQVGCSPQTVANVVNRHKQKQIQRAKSEAAYVHVQGKGQQL